MRLSNKCVSKNTKIYICIIDSNTINRSVSALVQIPITFSRQDQNRSMYDTPSFNFTFYIFICLFDYVFVVVGVEKPIGS